MERFESVEDCLLHHQRNRPLSWKEIALCVDRSERTVTAALKRLIKRKEVNVVVVRFKGKRVKFYTLRTDVDVSTEYPGAVFK